jgi:hypothetical protein
VAPGPPGGPATPAASPMPTSRYSPSRMIARCGGLFIQAVMSASGVSSGSCAHAIASPSAQVLAPSRYFVARTRSMTVAPSGLTCAKNPRATMSAA